MLPQLPEWAPALSTRELEFSKAYQIKTKNTQPNQNPQTQPLQNR